MNKTTCILCDEPAKPGREFCVSHAQEYDSSEYFFATDFIRERVHAMRDATLKYMESVQAEAGHLRMRAREFKAAKCSGYALANSVLQHLDVIAKEK